MTNNQSRFIERAVAEIDGLHRLLQTWFRAEGSSDPAAVFAHFDDDFVMSTPGGTILRFAQFVAAFPGMRGTRPGLIMTISDVAVRFEDRGAALISYREHQSYGDVANYRRSTALLLDRPDRATPVWRHLHETMEA